jgi:RNA polymerase sigma-32 factor
MHRIGLLIPHQPRKQRSLSSRRPLRHRALKGAIETLNPRQRRIFTARWLTDEPPTLEELAAEHGVSRERVRQIEQRAFQKVQAAMQSYGRGAAGKQPDL